jgi:hypothetical protein
MPMMGRPTIISTTLPKPQLQEVCPNCGEFKDELVSYTGWCFNCSAKELLGDDKGEVKVCPRCKRRFIPVSIRICRMCRKAEFLEQNADEIERQLAEPANKLSLTKAVQAVRDSKMTQCLCCGAPLKPATRGKAYFCARKSKCRTAYNKLHRYIYTLHMDKAEALELVLEGLHDENNRTDTQAAM